MRLRSLFIATFVSLSASLACAQASNQPDTIEQKQTATPPPEMAANAAAAQQATDDDGLVGNITDGRYFHASGLFSIRIPVIEELGGAIKDTKNSVTFMDDFLTHITIVAVPLDGTQRFELSSGVKKDFLVKFFRDNVMPPLAQAFPGTNWEKGRYLSEVKGGSIMLRTLLPRGSHFANRTALLGAADPVTVAKRGNLVFAHNDHVIIVSIELAERSTERSLYQKTAEQDDAILKQRLLDLAASMTMSPAAAAPAITVPGAK